jgi:hypothetical protein
MKFKESRPFATSEAIAHGWITLHPSGAYLSFTQEGADLFA